MVVIDIRTYEVYYRGNYTKHRSETFRGAAVQAFEKSNGTCQELGRRPIVERKSKGKETNKTREVIFSFDNEEVIVRRIK